MSDRGNMQLYIEWAKARLDEMDATLASFETQARGVQAESRAKGEQLIADLRKRRDKFQENIKSQAEAGEAAWRRTKVQLEKEWQEFEADVTKFIATCNLQVEQQRAMFRNVAAAQLKAWREASDKAHAVATGFAAERRADIDAAVSQMQTSASGTKARLDAHSQAATASWTAFSGALAQSRAAFDGVLQAAVDAFRRTGPSASADKPADSTSVEPPR